MLRSQPAMRPVCPAARRCSVPPRPKQSKRRRSCDQREWPLPCSWGRSFRTSHRAKRTNGSEQQALPPVEVVTLCGEVIEVAPITGRSEEPTSELQSLMRNSYAVFCLKNKNEQYSYTYLSFIPYTDVTSKSPAPSLT